MLIASIIFRYHIQLQWKRSVWLLTKYDNWMNTGAWKSIIIEIILVLLSPYPFFIGLHIHEHNLDYMIVVKYEVNDYLTMFMFCWVYFLFWLCLTLSQYMSSRSHRIGALNGCSMNQFALKCLMVDKPIELQSAAIALSVLIFAYTLWIFEHPLGLISGMNWTF